ncbi:Uma2 family endonuclease [uncultured Sphingomonas sp.]|uniref:Uma2 family endonuclease n=1 Tax=uncultured Sphingomonas sp. TaxID=158754 RepID=UPI0035CB982C
MNYFSPGFTGYTDVTGHRPGRFTTAEFLHMAEVGAFADIKVELVDGEIERMHSSMGTHGSFQASIIVKLWSAAGRRVMGETGIDLGRNTVLGCDAALLHRPMSEHRLLRPDEVELVVEVAQTSLDRDLGLKRARYAAAGIPYYWVVNTADRVTYVFGRPVDRDYRDEGEVAFPAPLPVPGADVAITLA